MRVQVRAYNVHPVRYQYEDIDMAVEDGQEAPSQIVTQKHQVAGCKLIQE